MYAAWGGGGGFSNCVRLSTGGEGGFGQWVCTQNWLPFEACQCTYNFLEEMWFCGTIYFHWVVSYRMPSLSLETKISHLHIFKLPYLSGNVSPVIVNFGCRGGGYGFEYILNEGGSAKWVCHEYRGEGGGQKRPKTCVHTIWMPPKHIVKASRLNSFCVQGVKMSKNVRTYYLNAPLWLTRYFTTLGSHLCL